MIGRTLDGRFTILALAGVGSMGAVYRARQRNTERDVAIKVLRRARDEAAKGRFLREARASSALMSPHTVRVFDFGETKNGELFLVMELLEGESLAQRLQYRKALPPAEAVEATLQALKSLREAHTKGLIHRDIKPANLFFAHLAGGDRADEIVKILDFGGAKFIGGEGKERNAIDTQEGFVVGTPRFMSPEQARGAVLDGRSDLYSLGVVLYNMLTGQAPFLDDDAQVILARHIRDIPERPSTLAPRAGIPPRLDELVMRALAKDPNERPATAEAMADELLEFSDAPRSSTHPSVNSVSDDAAPVVTPTVRHIDDQANTLPMPASGARSSANRGWWAAGVAMAAAVVLVAVTGIRRAQSFAPPPGSRAPMPTATAAAVDHGHVVVTSPPRASSSAVPVDALPRTSVRPLARSPSPAPLRKATPSSTSTVNAMQAAPPAAPPSAPPLAPTATSSSGYTYFE